MVIIDKEIDTRGLNCPLPILKAKKRSQLVRTRTQQILCIHNLLARILGRNARGQQIKALRSEQLDELDLLPQHKLAIRANLALLACVHEQIKTLEREVVSQAKLRENYQRLLTITGVGRYLALTIALESGDRRTLCPCGQLRPVSRMVRSRRDSNGKTPSATVSSPASRSPPVKKAHKMVEKPNSDKAPSQMGVSGSSALTPAVFQESRNMRGATVAKSSSLTVLPR